MLDSADVPAPHRYAFLNFAGSAAAPLSPPVIRQATLDDYKAYFPGKPVPTFDAVIAELDGKPVAMGGFAHYGGRILAFIDLKDEAKPYVMHLYREVRGFMDKAKLASYRRVYVVRQQDIETADRFIRHFGFEPVDEERTVYEWTG